MCLGKGGDVKGRVMMMKSLKDLLDDVYLGQKVEAYTGEFEAHILYRRGGFLSFHFGLLIDVDNGS
jgi:hypothetical protein